MSYRHHFISLSMLGLIAFVAWSFISFHPEHTTTLAKTFPDVIMEEVTALIMDKQGKPHMKIISPKMKHFATQDAAELTQPHVTLYRNSIQPWFITAKTAYSSNGVSQVTFNHDVVIQHATDLLSPQVLIKTASLTVHPDKKTAETSDPITLVQPNVTVNAKGMHADIENGDVKLLSEARGVYVPGN